MEAGGSSASGALASVVAYVCSSKISYIGGVVAYMHIGSTVICRHVHEAVTFALSWKREKEGERHDTIWKIGTIAQRIFTMKGKDEVLHSWGEAHVQREEMEGI